MNKKICFTIMGFGKKVDFSTGKTFDLDKTYLNIIKPTVEKCGYKSVRADEVQGSSLIDKSMYALLIRSELVIADITTLNPNALYELGVRHAARPNHTIIIKDKDGKIPFDLDHNRFILYTHLGEDVGVTEAESCRSRLESTILSIESKTGADSPVFEYLKDLTPYKLSDSDYEDVTSDLIESGNSALALSERARMLMKNSSFLEASELFERASRLMPDDHFFIQQRALCTYKSEYPSKAISLQLAIQIISKIYEDEKTNDPETLGLVGAIYKRLFECDANAEYLMIAMRAYKRGYYISGDYYTGENYATCLEKMSKTTDDADDKIHFMVEAKNIRKEIVSKLSTILRDDSKSIDRKWIFATMANCYFNLDKPEKGDEFEKKFLSMNPDEWEKTSYFDHKPFKE